MRAAGSSQSGDDQARALLQVEPTRAAVNRNEAGDRVWRGGGALLDRIPPWARWNDTLGRRYTVGVEEEVMLLRGGGLALAQRGDEVLARLSGGLMGHTSPETHAAVLELITSIHPDVGGATDELAALRGHLARELRRMGLAAASAGTYPLATPPDSHVSHRPRYRKVADSMRSLAHREPTLALHAHVGVPDPADAIRLLNGLRDHVPLLLALSANSPFSQGRDSGFASIRTAIFQAFPRTGTARRFDSYDDYVRTVDVLVRSGAVPDPTFLWWDLRLQPRLGTVEVRVMDAQSTIADTGALVALVQSLARATLEDEEAGSALTPEVLAENRFLAARDGVEARLIDQAARRMVPIRVMLDALIERCRPHAEALGCLRQFDRLEQLAAANGATRQRAVAAEAGLDALASALSQRFTTERSG